MITVDVNFIHGKIYTMEEEGSQISAFSVLDGKIVAVGSSEEIAQIPSKKTVDLHQQVVIPGLQDTHCHVSEFAEGSKKVNLSAARCFQDIIDTLSEEVKKIQPGDWLIADQVDTARLAEHKIPDRFVLDQASKTVPIFMSSIYLHDFLCNTAALEALHLDATFDRPEKKFMQVDEEGNPTGWMREHGMLPYINSIRPSVLKTEKENLDALEEALQGFAAKGVTTVHTYDGFDNSRCDDCQMYQLLEQKDRLPIRVIINKQGGTTNSLGAISGLGDGKVTYGAVKLFADGSFAQQSAYLRKPYKGTTNWFGIPICTDQEMEEKIANVYLKGNDVAIHVIGDGAVEQVLQAIEKVYDPARKQQFRLIHVSFSTPDQWKRMAQYPIVLDMQPVFIPNMALSVQASLEEERSQYVLPFHSLLAQGLIVTGGDDAPICNSNPFVNMQYAVTRQITLEKEEQFNKQECVTCFQALSMFTKNAAYAAHEEQIKGTLERGKLADFVVIDRDIFTIDLHLLHETQVQATYVGGSKVYDSGDLKRREG